MACYRKLAGVWFLDPHKKGERANLPRELAELLSFQGIVEINWGKEACN